MNHFGSFFELQLKFLPGPADRPSQGRNKI